MDPKTDELYVADGYGNHRVIVFDANTGKYKRHWGAYGHSRRSGILFRVGEDAAHLAAHMAQRNTQTGNLLAGYGHNAEIAATHAALEQ